MTRAFIFGAGATRAEEASCPLDTDFFKMLARYHKFLANKLFEELSEDMPEFSKAETLEISLEDVLTRIESFSSARCKHLQELIYKGIYLLLAGSTKSNEGFELTFRNLSPTTYHKTLVSECNTNDFFITLNYDLTLDMAVWEDRADYNNRASFVDYGFLEQQQIKEDFGELFVTGKQEKSIYHLHGSLNWGRRKNDKITVYPRAMPPLRSGSHLNPFIIPPGRKEYPQPIKDIWNTAEERLKEADELIIVGCSLNRADEELLKLVKGWVEQHPDGVKKVISKTPRETGVNGTGKMLDDYYRDLLGEDTLIFEEGFGLDAIEFIFKE